MFQSRRFFDVLFRLILSAFGRGFGEGLEGPWRLLGRIWRALGASWWIFGLHFWVLVLGMLSKRALGGFWEGLGLDLGSILEGLGGILGRFG